MRIGILKTVILAFLVIAIAGCGVPADKYNVAVKQAEELQKTAAGLKGQVNGLLADYEKTVKELAGLKSANQSLVKQIKAVENKCKALQAENDKLKKGAE